MVSSRSPRPSGVPRGWRPGCSPRSWLWSGRRPYRRRS